MADLERVLSDREQTRPEWINVVGITGRVTTEPSSMFNTGSAVHVEVMLWQLLEYMRMMRDPLGIGWLVFKTAYLAVPHEGASALFGISCKLRVFASANGNVLRITAAVEKLFVMEFNSDAKITLKSYKRTLTQQERDDFCQVRTRNHVIVRAPNQPHYRRMTAVVASHEINSDMENSRDISDFVQDNLFNDPDAIYRLSNIVWFRNSPARAATLLVRAEYAGRADHYVRDVGDRWNGRLRMSDSGTMVLLINNEAVATVRAAEGPVLPAMLDLVGNPMITSVSSAYAG